MDELRELNIGNNPNLMGLVETWKTQITDWWFATRAISFLQKIMEVGLWAEYNLSMILSIETHHAHEVASCYIW